MIQMFKKISGLYILAFGALLMLASAVPAYAASPADSVCKGANIAAGSDSETCESQSGTNVNSLIKTIINVFSFVVGVVAVIVIIYGGFTFVIANGDSANVAKARTIILYAIVGLVIVASAQLIVRFVLSQTT